MRYRRIVIGAAAAVMLTAALPSATPAYAAACTVPSTDYGTVSGSFSVSSAGTYRIWTRMAAPNASDNTYLLELDGTTCYTVGGAQVPTYGTGATTYFTTGTSNWTARTSGNALIDATLSSGSHTYKLIGATSGVVVDRIIVTADTGCVPTGTGDNCASIYVSADIDQNGSVNFLDFSRLASKYGRSGTSLGRSDINNDGTVDFLDYSVLASKYGQ